MKVITICGSFKFKKEIAEVAEIMTLAGNCVLTPNELVRKCKEDYTEEEARMIDLMHKEKIKLSDAIFVVNVGGYIGKVLKARLSLPRVLARKLFIILIL